MDRIDLSSIDLSSIDFDLILVGLRVGPENVHQAHPGLGGEAGTTRMLGFPSVRMGGGLDLHVTWFERPGQDAVRHTSLYTSLHTRSHDGFYEKTCQRVSFSEDEPSDIPAATFETVWNAAVKRTGWTPPNKEG